VAVGVVEAVAAAGVVVGLTGASARSHPRPTMVNASSVSSVRKGKERRAGR